MADPLKIVALGDTHFGHERVGRKKQPIHCERSIAATVRFIEDFRPDVFVHFGDAIDCSEISHWTRNKRVSIEGLRLVEDIKCAKTQLFDPLGEALPKTVKRHFLPGNHEDWLNQLIDEYPGLEDIVDVDALLHLTESGWEVHPHGHVLKVGKLHYAHGDNFAATQNLAKTAVDNYERNIRFGHFHTFQVATRISALDVKDQRTGIALPCLCKRGPSYGKKAPNRWVNGFSYGFIEPNGNFNDYVVVISQGEFVVDGKRYRG